jgi:hypothetical protein
MRKTLEKELIEYLRRIDKCENMAQVCFIYDHMPEKIKRLVSDTEE